MGNSIHTNKLIKALLIFIIFGLFYLFLSTNVSAQSCTGGAITCCYRECYKPDPPCDGACECNEGGCACDFTWTSCDSTLQCRINTAPPACSATAACAALSLRMVKSGSCSYQPPAPSPSGGGGNPTPTPVSGGQCDSSCGTCGYRYNSGGCKTDGDNSCCHRSCNS